MVRPVCLRVLNMVQMMQRSSRVVAVREMLPSMLLSSSRTENASVLVLRWPRFHVTTSLPLTSIPGSETSMLSARK